MPKRPRSGGGGADDPVKRLQSDWTADDPLSHLYDSKLCRDLPSLINTANPRKATEYLNTLIANYPILSYPEINTTILLEWLVQLEGYKSQFNLDMWKLYAAVHKMTSTILYSGRSPSNVLNEKHWTLLNEFVSTKCCQFLGIREESLLYLSKLIIDLIFLSDYRNHQVEPTVAHRMREINSSSVDILCRLVSEGFLDLPKIADHLFERMILGEVAVGQNGGPRQSSLLYIRMVNAATSASKSVTMLPYGSLNDQCTRSILNFQNVEIWPLECKQGLTNEVKSLWGLESWRWRWFRLKEVTEEVSILLFSTAIQQFASTKIDSKILKSRSNVIGNLILDFSVLALNMNYPTAHVHLLYLTRCLNRLAFCAGVPVVIQQIYLELVKETYAALGRLSPRPSYAIDGIAKNLGGSILKSFGSRFVRVNTDLKVLYRKEIETHDNDQGLFDEIPDYISDLRWQQLVVLFFINPEEVEWTLSFFAVTVPELETIHGRLHEMEFELGSFQPVVATPSKRRLNSRSRKTSKSRLVVESSRKASLSPLNKNSGSFLVKSDLKREKLFDDTPDDIYQGSGVDFDVCRDDLLRLTVIALSRRLGNRPAAISPDIRDNLWSQALETNVKFFEEIDELRKGLLRAVNCRVLLLESNIASVRTGESLINTLTEMHLTNGGQDFTEEYRSVYERLLLSGSMSLCRTVLSSIRRILECCSAEHPNSAAEHSNSAAEHSNIAAEHSNSAAEHSNSAAEHSNSAAEQWNPELSLHGYQQKRQRCKNNLMTGNNQPAKAVSPRSEHFHDLILWSCDVSMNYLYQSWGGDAWKMIASALLYLRPQERLWRHLVNRVVTDDRFDSVSKSWRDVFIESIELVFFSTKSITSQYIDHLNSIKDLKKFSENIDEWPVRYQYVYSLIYMNSISRRRLVGFESEEEIDLVDYILSRGPRKISSLVSLILSFLVWCEESKTLLSLQCQKAALQTLTCLIKVDESCRYQIISFSLPYLKIVPETTMEVEIVTDICTLLICVQEVEGFKSLLNFSDLLKLTRVKRENLCSAAIKLLIVICSSYENLLNEVISKDIQYLTNREIEQPLDKLRHSMVKISSVIRNLDIPGLCEEGVLSPDQPWTRNFDSITHLIMTIFDRAIELVQMSKDPVILNSIASIISRYHELVRSPELNSVINQALTEIEDLQFASAAVRLICEALKPERDAKHHRTPPTHSPCLFLTPQSTTSKQTSSATTPGFRIHTRTQTTHALSIHLNTLIQTYHQYLGEVENENIIQFRILVLEALDEYVSQGLCSPAEVVPHVLSSLFINNRLVIFRCRKILYKLVNSSKDFDTVLKRKSPHFAVQALSVFILNKDHTNLSVNLNTWFTSLQSRNRCPRSGLIIGLVNSLAKIANPLSTISIKNLNPVCQRLGIVDFVNLYCIFVASLLTQLPLRNYNEVKILILHLHQTIKSEQHSIMDITDSDIPDENIYTEFYRTIFVAIIGIVSVHIEASIKKRYKLSTDDLQDILIKKKPAEKVISTNIEFPETQISKEIEPFISIAMKYSLNPQDISDKITSIDLAPIMTEIKAAILNNPSLNSDAAILGTTNEEGPIGYYY